MKLLRERRNLFSIEDYIRDNFVEQVLDEADMYAREYLERMTHEEVFDVFRERINGRLV